jgi:hypothetical protein
MHESKLKWCAFDCSQTVASLWLDSVSWENLKRPHQRSAPTAGSYKIQNGGLCGEADGRKQAERRER